MSNLSGRISKIEQQTGPCFMERTCQALEKRFGPAALKRCFAFLDRQVLQEATKRSVAMLEDPCGRFSTPVDELQAWVESIHWTERDDEMESDFWKLRGQYERKQISAPATFLPFEPRTTEEQRSVLNWCYFIETDARARAMWAQFMEKAAQLAAVQCATN